jgi:predicted metal-dependent hydrolase
MKIELEGHVIEFHVQYGVRKKLSIEIGSTGLITVKAPNDTSTEAIMKAVERHSPWILEKFLARTKVQDTSKLKAYEEEGRFLHMGKEYLLHELIETEGLGEEELRSNLKKFYFASCKRLVAERIKIYQSQLRVKPKTVEVVESSTQWGSCSSSKKLTFNYRLAMAPIEAIDYVVIHELCHLVHMNHDRSFWRLVGSIMPDYKEKQEFLERFGHYMTL